MSGHVLIEKRRAVAGGLFGGDDGGERFDIERDRFGCILCLQQRLGDDEGHWITHITDAIDRKHIAPRFLQGRAVAVVERDDAFERAAIFQVGAGIDREHARHLSSCFNVDRADDPMRVAATYHHAVGLARKAGIVGIVPEAAHQHRIFAARNRLSNGKFLDR